jgi:hypothetical protein
MSWKDQLTSVFDVFSRRTSQRGPEYNPDQISERLRNRIIILYRDVLYGQWHTTNDPHRRTAPASSGSRYTTRSSFCMGACGWRRTLRRTRSSTTRSHSCSAEEFFDFLELSFRTDCMWRVVHERNQRVDAINEIFRVENAPYHLTPVVTLEEPDTGPNRRSTTIHWLPPSRAIMLI